jgi:hypothetical protein
MMEERQVEKKVLLAVTFFAGPSQEKTLEFL